MTTSSIELTPETYINRELSNIQFQWRVLALAQDPKLPLLERVKFLAIVANNLDEFFMVRVASYIQKVQLGLNSTRPDGLTPITLLRRIRDEVAQLMQTQRQVKQDVLAALAQEGIHLLTPADLAIEERSEEHT